MTNTTSADWLNRALEWEARGSRVDMMRCLANAAREEARECAEIARYEAQILACR